jgi:hypothetical protein
VTEYVALLLDIAMRLMLRVVGGRLRCDLRQCRVNPRRSLLVHRMQVDVAIQAA